MVRKKIDLGPTPDLDEIEAKSEAGRAHLILQKFDKLGTVLIDHEERLAQCETCCAPWHDTIIKWLVGLVISTGGLAIIYLVALAAGKIFGGGA